VDGGTNTGRLGLGGYGGAGACLASAFGCAVEVEMREFISFIIGAVFVAWLLLGYCFGLLPRLLVLPNRSAFLDFILESSFVRIRENVYLQFH